MTDTSTGLDYRKIDNAQLLITKLANVRNLRALLKYNLDLEGDQITAVRFELLNNDMLLMDMGSDVEGSPFDTDEMVDIFAGMLDGKEQDIIAELEAIGVKVPSHTPAPSAPKPSLANNSASARKTGAQRNAA